MVCRTSDNGSRGISLIAVEGDRPGFVRGRNLDKMGRAAQDTSELFFEEVRVPASNLIGEVEGRRLIGPALMNRARVTQASGRDEVLRMRSDWGLGFALPGGPLFPDMGVPGLFGHTGASESLAFADPDHDLAFGYTPNHWGELSGRGRTRFRSTEYAEEAFAGAGIRRWPVR